MMRKRNQLKKLVAVAVAAAFMAGCASPANTGVETKVEAKGGGSTQTNSPSETESSSQAKNETPAELTIHYHAENRFTILDEQGQILPVFLLAGEKTNTKVVNGANPVSQNSIEEFQLQATEKFPADLYGGVNIKSSIFSYALQGAFLPLNDLIEENGPNIKAFLDANPEVKAAMTAPDGNLYMLNYIPDGKTARAYMIRTDWLNTLGLPMPSTFEELEETLYAFRNNDPNGNGKKDEIPYFNDRWQEMIRLVNLWGARAYSYDNYNERIPVNGNGKLYHAWMTDDFKEGITNLNRWYQDGIIDSEIFTRKADTARQTLWAKENNGGLTHEWVASTASYNYKEDLLNLVKEFKVEGMLPVSAKGKAFEEHQRATVKPDGWAISASCKNPEAAIRYMDWFYSEEGRRAINYGIEGESYTIEGGKPVFTAEVLNQGAVNLFLKTKYGAQLAVGYQQDYEYERQWTVKEGQEAYDLYANADIWSEPWTPVLNFTEEETELFDQYVTGLNDYQNEKISAFITGKEDIQTGWPSYLETCRQLGADRLVEIYQAAYDRYLESK